jgi:hypothetical protein
MRSLQEIERTASLIVYGVATTFLGVLLFVVLRGQSILSGTINLAVGWDVGDWAVVIYGLLYVGFIYPFYRHKGVWVFGLMLWLADGFPNLVPFLQGTLGSRPDAWVAYNIFSVSLFALSFYMLRHDFRLEASTFVLLPMVVVLPFLGLGLGSAEQLDLVTIALVLSATKRPRVARTSSG